MSDSLETVFTLFVGALIGAGFPWLDQRGEGGTKPYAEPMRYHNPLEIPPLPQPVFPEWAPPAREPLKVWVDKHGHATPHGEHR